MSRSEDAVLRDAALIARHLDAIRKVVRESIWAESRQAAVPLTPPQILALRLLVEHDRQTGSGLSLSELAKRMGLAHSTVSGIVARLEARDLLRRTVRADDRRFTRIELTAPVREWLDRDLAAARLDPLARALSRTSAAEAKRIMHALATLEALLADVAGERGE